MAGHTDRQTEFEIFIDSVVDYHAREPVTMVTLQLQITVVHMKIKPYCDIGSVQFCCNYPLMKLTVINFVIPVNPQKSFHIFLGSSDLYNRIIQLIF